jgi:ferredoxin, 2Fe-2S
MRNRLDARYLEYERSAFMSEANGKSIPADKLVRVTFLPEGRTVEFEFGTLAFERHGKPMSILDVAQNFDVFLDHACGGVCACSTCHILIKKGAEGLSEADDDELDRLDMAADPQLDSRLGCQTVITRPGEYVVEIPKWNRNYVAEGKPLASAEEK